MLARKTEASRRLARCLLLRTLLLESSLRVRAPKTRRGRARHTMLLPARRVHQPVHTGPLISRHSAILSWLCPGRPALALVSKATTRNHRQRFWRHEEGGLRQHVPSDNSTHLLFG